MNESQQCTTCKSTKNIKCRVCKKNKTIDSFDNSKYLSRCSDVCRDCIDKRLSSKKEVCTCCGGGPTKRDINTNEGRLTKFNGGTFCDDCFTTPYPVKNANDIMEEKSMTGSSMHLVSNEVPIKNFTLKEKARIDDFANNHKLGMTPQESKNYMFSNAKNAARLKQQKTLLSI